MPAAFAAAALLIMTTPSNAQSLAGSEWRLIELTGTILDGGNPLSVRFGANGKLAGNGGCNRFFGNYKIEGTNLSIGPLASTRRACAPEVMELEHKFLKALEATRSFHRVAIADMHLFGGNGHLTMRLARTDWD